MHAGKMLETVKKAVDVDKETYMYFSVSFGSSGSNGITVAE